ncbi:MAG: D-2-hydroxyacid dehydrogenase [Anaerolineaceae bacterium]|jgi:phosphoglycerate dehydrogenase-like enzyme|nr:D-2-hydroxyacid dehydrogenase [Anaerolineaceae bacterium]MDD4042312.1 D-2-hydroxyacid dehydrogenase [Anaerolineaceae bacterium]MDD4577730.1 D-2-hydroxyacid dehydrogenase [Anaerolineaceae bacterium]
MDAKQKIEILSTLDLNEEQLKRIVSLDERIKVGLHKQKEMNRISDETWRKTEILLTRGTTLPPVEKVPNLRWIQSSWAGVENLLDNPLLHQESVRVTNASGANVSQMGEYVIMMLLMLGHKMPQMIRAQHEKRWIEDKFTSLQPRELRGSTVGIVGYGSIGREVARQLYAYGAKVLASKRDAMHPEDSGYTPVGLGDPQGNYFDRLYPIEGLRGMLEECDFVVLTLPHTKSTECLFVKEMFDTMKPGSYFVNVSRGQLVDEGALVEALNSGHLAGAALDVFTQEPLPPESPLWNAPNLILTPHISAYSPNMFNQVVDLFVENLKRYLKDQPLYNLVNVERGY